MPKIMKAPVIKGMTINGVPLYIDNGGKEIEKYCPECNNLLPISHFGLRNMRLRGGGVEVRLQPWCKDCR